MASYPGMSLGGEVRESISLDEDDLSDVEDEVFIRDGKNSYKVAEELNVKRPLMAPRRKLGKPDITTRLKARPPCKAFCKPCCYIFAALTILIGIIALVVVLVSIFPLPLDRLRNWVLAKSKMEQPITVLPCERLKVNDVWSVTLPILTTDSPVRTVDIDRNGVEDILFGFGTGDNYDAMPPDWFCPIFMGVPPPCEGGVIALNGSTGDIVWRYWVNDTIFNLQCSADLNADGLEDCLAVGTRGTILALDTKNGSLIWRQDNDNTDIFVANLIPDQNNDSVAEILASHTSLSSNVEGHLVLISGKTGIEIKRVQVPYHAPTFFMPHLFRSNNTDFVIFGTGTPKTPGNLSLANLQELVSGNMSAKTLYQDKFKGVLTQPVLVDITGDNITDIVVSMFNSTVVAINGATFKQIWNYTIPNSESNVTPTPGYFNDDNVTDFLIIYETHDDILNYNYTKSFIIDGKTGRPVSASTIGKAVATQMNGLTLSMESKGFDMYVYWTVRCVTTSISGTEKLPTEDRENDFCSHGANTTSGLFLNAINQFDEPPGFEIFNSAMRLKTEFQHNKSPMRLIKEYFEQHPKLQMSNVGQLEVDENYGINNQKIRVDKYGPSSFRHRQGLNPEDVNPQFNEPMEHNEPIVNEEEPEDDYNDGGHFSGESIPYDNMYVGRDPRSKKDILIKPGKSKKKNLSSPKYGIYDYQNIKNSRNRLRNDLNNLPSDILRDTYYKNRESQLRKSRFEQRDITSHVDKIKQNEEVKNILEQEKQAENTSYTLWDLESEKELKDKENGYWRGKRQALLKMTALRKVTSVGAILKPINTTNNSLDIVFITYWVPPKIQPNDVLQEALDECLNNKLSNSHNHSYTKNTEKEQRELYINECKVEQDDLRTQFEYFNQIYQLRLGEMNIYRLRVECWCYPHHKKERCAKFLPSEQQMWPMYLGKLGDGVPRARN